MTGYPQHNGFSLTEVLLATGILAIGMAMIAMVFPVGIKLASLATERTIGVVAGNEAFAKIRLYWVKPYDPNASPWNTGATEFHKVADVVSGSTLFDPAAPSGERIYPSLVPPSPEQKYYWSALVWKTGTDSSDNVTELKARVFVCRVLAMGAKYYTPAGTPDGKWPVPVKVNIVALPDPNYIVVQPNTGIFPIPTGSTTPPVYAFFTEGCMIVEDTSGNKYQVVETKDMDANPGKERLRLSEPFAVTGLPPYYVWVVPPAVGSSRNPCIDVVSEDSLHR